MIRYENTTHNFYFWTQNTHRMILDGTGNLGVGTNFFAPQSTVHIHSSGNSTGTFAFKVENTSGSPMLAVRDDGFTGVGTTAFAPASTFDVSGTFGLSGQFTTSIAGTYSMGNNESVIFVTVTGCTIMLPAPATCKGRIYVVKETAAFLTTTIDATIGNVDGTATYTMGNTGSRQGAAFMSDGTNWWTIWSIP